MVMEFLNKLTAHLKIIICSLNLRSIRSLRRGRITRNEYPRRKRRGIKP